MYINDIRKQFLDFFKAKQHLITPSHSLYPSNDPSLLFVNAGMVPLKDYFSGVATPPSNKIASIQKCIRTTDLDIIGTTKRHLSFFEMLGNFSFNNYFKKEAIEFAWEFSLDILKLDSQKIWITIYNDDDEAEGIWHQHIGIPKNRIIRLGKKDNFWGPAGKTGPCGPCSELYLDRGVEIEQGSENKKPGDETERFLEYWNLVFNQFYKNNVGDLKNLQHKGIDTGAGLERLAVLLQKVDSVFETNELNQLLTHIEKEITVIHNNKRAAYRVITDHIRSLTFAISDDILPSNESRGYILRKLVRKAFLQVDRIKYQDPILFRLVDKVNEIYGNIYSNIHTSLKKIQDVIYSEEQLFLKTLENGQNKLNDILDKSQSVGIISGKDLFLLYDTYGLPLEVIQEIGNHNHIGIDKMNFYKELEKQKEQSKKTWKSISLDLNIAGFPETLFLGYEQNQLESEILGIFYQNKPRKHISQNDIINDEDCFQIITKQTCFYPEGGGQLADIGKCSLNNNYANIIDAQKVGNIIVHICSHLKGTLHLNDILTLEINTERRQDLAINHTATHLLNASLKNHLGNHIIQKGSLVHPEYLRFDFTHSQPLTETQVFNLEKEINQIIHQQILRTAVVMDIEKAKNQNAVMTFGEKYGNEVRVVSLGDFSKEFCAGTHVQNTSEIKSFIITKEMSSSFGIRRIEAKTALRAHQHIESLQKKLLDIIKEFLNKSDNVNVNNKLKNFQEKIHNEFKGKPIHQTWIFLKHLEKEIVSIEKQIKKSLKVKNKAYNIDPAIINRILTILPKNNILHDVLPNQTIEYLKALVDKLREKNPNIIFFLQSYNHDTWSAVLATTKNYSQKMKLHLGKTIQKMMKSIDFIEGGGGGKEELAQASGKFKELINIEKKLDYIYEEIKKTL